VGTVGGVRDQAWLLNKQKTGVWNQAWLLKGFGEKVFEIINLIFLKGHSQVRQLDPTLCPVGSFNFFSGLSQQCTRVECSVATL
jgi:hypothetical protein